jgi:transposase
MPTTKLQNSNDFRGQSFFIGIDVHKNSWSVTVRSLNLFIEHFSQPPSAMVLINYLHKKYPGGEYHSAYEAGFCETGQEIHILIKCKIKCCLSYNSVRSNSVYYKLSG